MAKKRKKSSMYQGVVKAKLAHSRIWKPNIDWLLEDSLLAEDEDEKVDLSPFVPSSNLKTSRFSVTQEPLPDNPPIPAELRPMMEPLHMKVMASPKDAIPDIKDALLRFPDVPQLNNFLVAALCSIGRLEDARIIIEHNIEQHPDYLFAKINYADILVRENRLNECEALFDSKFDLKLLYPDRDIFHVSEALGFYDVTSLYFIKRGQLQSAKVTMDILEAIDPEYPHLISLKGLLRLEQLAEILRVRKKRRMRDHDAAHETSV